MSTVVSLHAHPDDEALLTAGTLARAAAEGHRVVLVVATAGEAGLAAGGAGGTALASRRTDELVASALAIGAARVELLGYADSGSSGILPRGCFAAMDPSIAAQRVARVLWEEEADVLTGYDAHGGYGHPDHVQVHRVARLAARLAGTPTLLEATLPREPFALAIRALSIASRVVPVPELRDPAAAYTSRREITHRIDVRDHLDAKLASLAAHTSQTGGGPRTLSLLLRLPRPVQRRLLGQEYFVDPSGPHTLTRRFFPDDPPVINRRVIGE